MMAAAPSSQDTHASWFLADGTRARLARLTELLEEAERSAHLGSWDWDITSNAVTWSAEMYRVYGMEPGGPPPTFEDFLARVHPDDRAMVEASVRGSFERHTPFAFDHRILRPDGSERTLHAEGRVILDANGRPVRMVGSGQDITERKLADSERERLVKELEGANRAKMQFLAAMSHELRTPLNAINGYAELLAMEIRGPVNAEQIADLGRIRRNGHYLLSLINDILNFAKLEAGQVEMRVADVVLDEALAEIEALVSPQIADKGLHYHYRPCDPALTARGDRDKVQQVVLNLVTNAVKFTGPGGTIALTCQVDGDYARIRVADTGVGIPGEKLKIIFDPFVQVSRTPGAAPSYQGVGLGLAICRDLVNQMGGEMTVESTVGVGSTFGFTLPRGARK